jgi:hypothetical protein
LGEYPGEDRFSRCEDEAMDALVCILKFYTPERGDWRTIPDFVEKSTMQDYHMNPGNMVRYFLAMEEVDDGVAACSLG